MKNKQVSLGKGESFGFPFFLSVSRGSPSGSQNLKTKGSQATVSLPFVFPKFFRIAEIDYPTNSYILKSNNLTKEDKSCVIIKFLTMCQEVLTIKRCLFRVVEPTLLEAWHCARSMKRNDCIASPRAMNPKTVNIMIGKLRGSCPFFYFQASKFPRKNRRILKQKTRKLAFVLPNNTRIASLTIPLIPIQ
jgi:hypothetical protein